MGNLWLGRYGVRSTSGLVTRPPSGRQRKGHLDLSGSLQISSFTPRKAGIVNFSLPPSQSPALDRSSQLLPSFVKQAPWAEYLRKINPSPSQREKRRGSSANFHAKRSQAHQKRLVKGPPVCRSGHAGSPHTTGPEKPESTLLGFASFRIGAPHDRPTRAPCSCQRQPWAGP